jgi:hypothetical protein
MPFCARRFFIRTGESFVESLKTRAAFGLPA